MLLLSMKKKEHKRSHILRGSPPRLYKKYERISLVFLYEKNFKLLPKVFCFMLKILTELKLDNFFDEIE